MNMATTTLKVKVISDVVCPFCYLGKKNFEKAVSNLDKKDLKVELEWLPY